MNDDVAAARKAVNQENFNTGAWEQTTWRGVHVFKYPEDLWTYQEIISLTRPTVIVETGTAQGGSAMYLADLLEMFGGGRVITIDVKDYSHKDARVTYIRGSSVDPRIVRKVADMIEPDDRVMVCLDSEHLEEHVLAELGLWPALVTEGQYLVVEDTFISRYGCEGERFQDGSTWQALQRWYPTQSEFEVDESRDKYLLSMNPGGWLRRVSPPS